LGPRQTGKTTLTRATFPNHTYISFEKLNDRQFAQDDPERFLQVNENQYGVILDEIQYVPDLLSYIQVNIDLFKRPGYFILTGSQNLLIRQAVSQTLAGRIAICTLLPLSVHELANANLLPSTADSFLMHGGYPRVYDTDVEPVGWYLNYIATYIERDVRDILKVVDLSAFGRFMKLLAGRTGQILNVTSLSSDCGISQPTVQAWISVLEASYIIFLLQPHDKSFNRRLIRSPKIFFYDSGLCVALLGIENQKQIETHYLYGNIFETMVVSELYKAAYNKGKKPNVYFWRESHGHEIDCVIEHGQELIPVEVKSAQTIKSDFFIGLDWWNNLTGSDPQKGYLVYGGTQNQPRSKANVIGWQSIGKIRDDI